MARTKSRVRRKSLGGEVGSNGETTPLLQPSDEVAESQEDIDILGKCRNRDAFHEGRWRCIFNTYRAVQNLSHWARLDIKIESASDLIDPADTYFIESSANSFAKVFSDDVFVYETQVQRTSQNPTWNHNGFLNILAPRTMVRIHVCHCSGSSEVGIGFVEFCVGDIPFDEDIDGLFELRFQETMTMTSIDRYKDHCRKRDDYTEEAKESTSALTTRSDDSLSSHASVEARTFMSKKLRRHSSSCFCRQSPLERRLNEQKARYRKNAGEICLRLKLTRVCSKTDGIFALALESPPPQDFGVFVDPEVPAIEDMQGLYDETTEVKLALLDDTAICIYNYFVFILQWRRKWLSGIILVMFVTACEHEWLHGTILLFAISLVLSVNSNEDLRLDMTCSGHNAPLTEQGFKLVARMGNVANMEKFLQRTIESRLGAAIASTEGGQLALVAERCFMDGLPRLGYEELKSMLKSASWIKMGRDLAVGSLVMVDERHKAIVCDLKKDKVTVEYENNSHKKKPKRETVARECVVARPQMLKIPPGTPLSQVVPDVVDGNVRRLRFYMDKARFHLVPHVNRVRAVLTWEQSGLTRAINLVCLFSALTLFVFHEWYRMCSEDAMKRSVLQRWLHRNLNVNCGSHRQWLAYMRAGGFFHALLIFVLDHGLTTVFLIVGCIILVMGAGWLVPFKAVVRIVFRLATMKRRAPENWAFFRDK